MGEIIIKDAVRRRPGFLYYIDGEGSICEAELKNNKKKAGGEDGRRVDD